ncbi:hypothetical protein D8O27_03580 [Burkholderia mallei]|uniref:Uncharacterized protein n=3 Tax=pseudomallei group TaxID=111527 RepID=A0AAX1X7R8_BURML|nr:hypothetical protein BURPS668_3994 [Burkholderia pseudomallei 668]ARK49096.1 hypothetical protein BOC35_23070 [Burkholderia pseudomallei]EEH30726.1 conserved hypothetical protein [Burkholderia pseudomallei Pakistan 9]PNX03106.1 hypothetical protein CF649_13585 [Burkholderia sp. 136(2017)]PNX14345.1 hypothetical protein CF650_15815 [Burkholderia sp. 129]PNX29855.1 hypothetical protein CF647_12430 [Burkholderia sp. 117]PNX38660.1 hypothetical protein CF648_13590 [Burkholderia sp. 137]RKO020
MRPLIRTRAFGSRRIVSGRAQTLMPYAFFVRGRMRLRPKRVPARIEKPPPRSSARESAALLLG